ncbi:MAG TPA: hypothetical protein VJY54_03010 [Lachnospiraceae bacterium]|nr:hypothetical protein [Lachnospiraceae bacterium]
MADKIQAFDTLFTNNHIQMYKILLPYFESDIQKKLAVYIKYMEFEYTSTYIKLHPYAYTPKENAPDTNGLLQEILPFCAGDEKNRLNKLMDMVNNMKNAQDMMETLNTMKELFPDGFSFDGDMDMMKMFSQMEGFNGK